MSFGGQAGAVDVHDGCKCRRPVRKAQIGQERLRRWSGRAAWPRSVQRSIAELLDSPRTAARSTVHATDPRKQAKLGFSPARLRFLSEANANYGFAVRNYPAAQVLGSDWIGAKSTRLAIADRCTTNLELQTAQAVTQMDPANSRGLRRMKRRLLASHVWCRSEK